MPDKPIYHFNGLKKLLTQKGYTVGKAEVWRKIDSEEVSLKDGILEFSSEGIFLKDKDGISRQVFLYKRKYKLFQYGKPRFHICRCQTINSFLSGNDIPEYRRANTKSVKVLDLDNNLAETEVDDLPLCKYCAAIIYHDNNYDLNSSEFSDILRNAAEVDTSVVGNTEIDRYGYTKDWQEISSNFRKQRNYICDKCGVQVTQFESEFMHVHHKNGNRMDNKASNLQCLCIKCHSEINTAHIRNFSTRSQQLLLRLFKERYG